MIIFLNFSYIFYHVFFIIFTRGFSSLTQVFNTVVNHPEKYTQLTITKELSSSSSLDVMTVSDFQEQQVFNSLSQTRFETLDQAVRTQLVNSLETDLLQLSCLLILYQNNLCIFTYVLVTILLLHVL